MTNRSDLASSSLKDLLKICRSHSLQLPPQLPEDKHFYIDLILQHRRAMREAEGSGEEGRPSSSDTMDSMSEGYVRVSSSSTISTSIAAAEGKEQREIDETIMQEVEGDYADDEEAEFHRSPIIQKLMGILEKMTLFDFLERHTSIPRFYWFMVMVLIVSISLFLWIGPLAVANFICFVYPAYRTFKTLEGKFLTQDSSAAAATSPEVPGASSSNSIEERPSIESDHSIDVHRYWLTYWIVYGLFRLFEFLGDYTLYWIPYYHPGKIIFLIWCFHPTSAGCALVYTWIIRPVFLPREPQIDRFIYRLTSSLNQAGAEVKGIILKKVAKRIAGGSMEDTPVKEQQRKEQ